MERFRLRSWFLLALVLASFACGDDGDGATIDGDDDPLPPDATFAISGTVLDLATREPVDGTATVVVGGLDSDPAVTVSGSDFSIEVPANSTFHLLAGSPPDYRNTYNAAIEVTESDREGLELYAVSEAYLADLAEAFEVTAGGTGGIVLMQVVDDSLRGLAGVPADAFLVPDGVMGPYFLDADLLAAPEREETSESGFVMFMDVAPGIADVQIDPEAGYALAVPDSPVANTTVSYFQAVATAGEDIVVPTNVSFERDVAPIFSLRGCTSCHDGGGIGKDLGGVHFNGAAEKMYKELAVEVSPNHGITRVNLEDPENSLVLALPRCQALICPPEEGADVVHPFATFTGPSDVDFVTIRVWIEEGALNN